MEAILLGIDGTGPLANSEYRAVMRSSFVSYIVRSSPASCKRFMRGPAWDGLDMSILIAEGYAFVHLNRITHPQAPVFLIGYSRGGAGVVAVATRLARDNVKVTGMVLFDAVDRALGATADEIPTNVERVVYARRDTNAFTRRSFGNCATRWHAPTRCDMKVFRGTHGALGGVPARPEPGVPKTQFISEGFPEASPTFISYDQDALAARAVWTWVEPRVRSLGFFGSSAATLNASV
jgi:hypothetical protein